MEALLRTSCTATIPRKLKSTFSLHTRSCYTKSKRPKLLERGVLSIHSSSSPEVEVKLRLADKAARDRVADLLQPSLLAKHEQENFFFDGANKELSRNRVVVRCRLYNQNLRAVLTVKGQQVIKEGIGRGSEVEEDIEPSLAQELIKNPDAFWRLDLDIIQPILSFVNIRNDYDWIGHKLELDSTMFPWGTVYEIEVETENPNDVRKSLETFLDSHSIPHQHSKTTKFANFINGTLL